MDPMYWGLFGLCVGFGVIFLTVGIAVKVVGSKNIKRELHTSGTLEAFRWQVSIPRFGSPGVANEARYKEIDENKFPSYPIFHFYHEGKGFRIWTASIDKTLSKEDIGKTFPLSYKKARKGSKVEYLVHMNDEVSLKLRIRSHSGFLWGFSIPGLLFLVAAVAFIVYVT